MKRLLMVLGILFVAVVALAVPANAQVVFQTSSLTRQVRL
jgi:hypothetical protein